MFIFINFENPLNTYYEGSEAVSELPKDGKSFDIFNANIISDIPRIENLFDEKRNTKTLWKSDKQCERFKVHYGEKLPEAYLVSYPRSGNTWVRYLIEGATGLFTGSVYNSKKQIKMGFVGESEFHRNGTVIIIKTHDFPAQFKHGIQVSNNEIPIVLLIRNPQRYFEIFCFNFIY
ncbi:UNVERIFIED_CONTAM: hypothetical protein RMT77_001321 [Armadillidium vulgare]